jgi:hypothetical protein
MSIAGPRSATGVEHDHPSDSDDIDDAGNLAGAVICRISENVRFL